MRDGAGASPNPGTDPAQWLCGNRSVQIQHVHDATITISYAGLVGRLVPLQRAVVPPGPGVQSPARLVRARSGVVPYVARGGLLGELEDWVTTPQAFAGAVVGGRGGSGKTRLAVALCLRAEASSWLAGLLAPTGDQGALEALVQAPTARLVVVDYAETRVDQLDQLVPLLAANATVDSPVRVLLLVRARPRGSTDWAELLRDRSEVLDACLDEMVCFGLEEHPLTLVERQALFGAAFVALGARTTRAAGAPAPPGTLATDLFASPLMVVIAAYLALHDERELPAYKAELFERLLVHEQRYWQPSADNVGLGEDIVLQHRIVALATLTEAKSERRARDVLALLEDFTDASAERRGALARWVHRLYPTTDSFWNALEPDLFGEYLIATTYVDDQRVLAGVLDADDAIALVRPLEVYARAVVEYPELRPIIAEILTGRLWVLCEIAREQAASTIDLDTLLGDGTLAAALERAARVVPLDPTVLPEILDKLSMQPTLMLRPLVTTLGAQLLAYWRGAADSKPDQETPQLARALLSHSANLTHAGRHEDALSVVGEALEIYRRLGDARPHAVLPHLEAALNNSSAMLNSLGRHDEALSSIEEAVQIRRGLADVRPDEFLDGLAASLDNQSIALGGLGRREDALRAIDESVQIRRRLADGGPDAFSHDLSTSLANQSIALSSLGRHEDALSAIDESVEICRRLADARPDAFLPDLAGSLNEQSNILSDLGRREQALTTNDEAIAIFRKLADARPDAFLHELAASLNNQSNRLHALDLDDDALIAIDEAIVIRRQLADTRPDSSLPELAMSRSNQSTILKGIGRSDDALSAIDEAVAICRRLADARPDAFLPDLASALTNQSTILSDLVRRGDALSAIDEAVDIYRRLTDSHPDRFARGLAAARTNQSVMLSALERHEDALSAIDEAVEIYWRLAARRPDATLRSLAGSLDNQSAILSAIGRPEAALDAITEALRLVLPRLEQDHYFLPDAGLQIGSDYVRQCGEANRTPDADLTGRLRLVLLAAGVILEDMGRYRLGDRRRR